MPPIAEECPQRLYEEIPPSPSGDIPMASPSHVNNATSDSESETGSSSSSEDDVAAAEASLEKYYFRGKPEAERHEVDNNLEHPGKCLTPDLSDTFRNMKTDEHHVIKRRTSPIPSSKPYDQKARSAPLAAKKEQTNPKPVCTPTTVLNSMEKDYRMVLEDLVDFIMHVVCVEKFDDFQCYEDARKLAQVTVLMTKRTQLYKFTETFGHSLSCSDPKCNNTCRMFRRIRNHVSTATHPCAVMHVYSQLLRLHIDTCTIEDCGLVTCKSMFAMRQRDGHSVLPHNFELVEKVIANKIKEMNTEVTVCKKEPGCDVGENCKPLTAVPVKEDPSSRVECKTHYLLNSKEELQGKQESALDLPEKSEIVAGPEMKLLIKSEE